MFGFLKGYSSDPNYRRLYARACQCHFSNNGRLASLFHSYEAVVLFSLACDLEIIRKPESGDATCCQLRQRTPQDDQETKVGQFCAAFAMLLLQIKLLDDWKDDRSLTSKVALRVFARPIRRATAYFQLLDPEFESKLSSILNSHQDLERSNSDVSLEQFQSATRTGFAYIFGLFALRFAPDKHQNLKQIGGELGGAIIAFDCAADWRADLRRRRYNPLRNMAEVSQAYEECARCLSRASWYCHQLTEESREPSKFADAIVRKSMQLSLQLAQHRPFAATHVPPHKRIPRLSKSYSLRRGDCDICCAIEACDVGCCASEAGGSALEFAMCCDPVCCDLTGCNSDKKKGRKKGGKSTAVVPENAPKSELRELIGSRGQTSGQLNPAGLVTIQNKTYPASSRSGLYIDADVEVMVVDVDSFGLKVMSIDQRS